MFVYWWDFCTHTASNTFKSCRECSFSDKQRTFLKTTTNLKYEDIYVLQIVSSKNVKTRSNIIESRDIFRELNTRKILWFKYAEFRSEFNFFDVFLK